MSKLMYETFEVKCQADSPEEATTRMWDEILREINEGIDADQIVHISEYVCTLNSWTLTPTYSLKLRVLFRSK
jgi:hypothetical protein